MTKKTKRAARGFATKKPPEPKAVITALPQTSSWQLFIVNLQLIKRFGAPLGLFIVIPALLSQLGSLLSGNVTYATSDAYVLTGYACSFVAGILSLLGFAPAYYYVLRVLGGNPPGIIESYRKGVPYTWRLLLIGLATACAALAGFALLIVPGLIWLRRYFLSIYFVIDDGLDVREALIASSTASKPIERHIWTMFGIVAAAVGLALVSTKFIPVYGISLAVFISASYVFLPALRYQEMTSDVRAGALAFKAVQDDSRQND